MPSESNPYVSPTPIQPGKSKDIGRQLQEPQSNLSPSIASKSANSNAEKQNGKDHERCMVEEVALVVPDTDEPSLPVMTFRTWFLDLGSCIVLIFLNTFFTYRTQPLTISAILMQIAVLPIGKFMAPTLPDKEYSVLGWRFSLNSGPFNIKEHVVITMFANCGFSFGGGDAYSIGAINVMKAYYKQSLNFLYALLLVLTTPIIGYGWAGMLGRCLVDSVEMWWPSNLVQVSLFSFRRHHPFGRRRIAAGETSWLTRVFFTKIDFGPIIKLK